LRQEFRELEMLDDICTLYMNGQLPYELKDSTHYAMIGDYRRWRGNAYVPDKVHTSIKWGSNDKFGSSEV
ncbi:hypothetical protein CYLTODRAFT_325118, partial [Cylindrobasidium torrendii FP15055 ss-10]